MSDGLELWNKVCETDPSTTKEVGFGRKFTAIDAYAQIMKATELWGPYGMDWGLTHVRHTPIEGTTMMLVEGHFKYPSELPNLEKGGEFPVSSSILYVSEKGKVDDDFAKKVETDLITKALSRLGFNADVFLGKFDDNKYVQAMSQKFQVVDKPVDQKKVENAAAFFKNEIDKDNWDNVEEIKREFRKLNQSEQMAIGNLLNEKAPDSNRLYKTLLKDYLKYVPEEGVAE